MTLITWLIAWLLASVLLAPLMGALLRDQTRRHAATPERVEAGPQRAGRMSA